MLRFDGNFRLVLDRPGRPTKVLCAPIGGEVTARALADMAKAPPPLFSSDKTVLDGTQVLFFLNGKMVAVISADATLTRLGTSPADRRPPK